MMNFNKLAFNPASRLNEIVRYSSVYQETNENLAEHVAEVSLMSYFIAKSVNQELGKDYISIGVLLEKCLLHDIDEVITGDIPRNTKYATTEGHKQMNLVAEDAIKLIESTLDTKIGEIWSNAKELSEGRILKVVDMLVVVKKAITEIELRGNLSFLKVVTELEGHLTKMLPKLKSDKCQTPEEIVLDDYLYQLVSEAKDEIVTIRVKYNHLIDKYMIKENVIKGE